MDYTQKKRLLILTGPTAVGKTRLSLRLAVKLGAEIISADSMQVYRGMDIGTDKIKPENMGGIPHHLIDIVEPDERFDVYQFKSLAAKAIQDIYSRDRLPMITGGTGFYIQSVLYDIDFEEEDDAGEYRAWLSKRVEEGGEEAVGLLWKELESADPEAAKAIHENNVKRVIRALEYHHLTGRKLSDHNREQRCRKPIYDGLYFVLTDDRARLYEKINKRVDEMIDNGLEAEVRGLLAESLTGDEQSMLGLGYRQMLKYIKGECSIDEAVELIKRDTRHFAKRQLTWFKRERDVRMIDRSVFSSDEEAFNEIMRQINEAWR